MFGRGALFRRRGYDIGDGRHDDTQHYVNVSASSGRCPNSGRVGHDGSAL